MDDYKGEGAGNLDYSSRTYEQLRAAVYGVNEDALRTAANEWADLKRRLNERVGTLRVEIVKLQPAWNSPAGQQALKTLAGQRDWMAEFARVAGLNEDRMTRAQETYRKALKAMQALDAEAERPNPSPAPGPGGYVNPADLNWKQPKAARIANYLYADLAIAAATMQMPPRSPGDKDDYQVAPTEKPEDRPGPPTGTHARGGDSNSIPPLADAPVSKAADNAPGLVIANPPSTRSPSGSQSPTTSAKGVPPLVGAPTATGRQLSGGPSSGVGNTASRSGQGSAGQGTGSRPGAGRVITSPAGTGNGPPAVTDPGTKTLGGGLRPPPGTPVGPGEVPPGGTPHPGTGGPGTGGGRAGKKKPGYERGEPDTFRDTRAANTIGGQVGKPARAARFDPLPGMLGTQRQQGASEDQRAPWEVPEPKPIPEGFPEELRDFKRPDGTQFQVRRRGNAV